MYRGVVMRESILLRSTIILVIVILVINAILKYLITKNKIKANKVSKIFYKDDKTFIKSFEIAKERGKIGRVMYVFEDSISCFIIMACYFGAYYSKGYILTWFILLITYAILILLFAPSRWNAAQEKYHKLKEKEKMGNDNINIKV